MAQPVKILPQQEIASFQLNLAQQDQEPQIPPQDLFAITTSHKASQKKQMRRF